MSVSVELKNVTKKFGTVIAVDQVDLAIPGGEFFSLLGPSGCGKSTTLRLIAGLENPDCGDICINEKIVTDLPPYERSSNMMFQNYALFPHLNIYDNIAFGLRVNSRLFPEDEIEKKVKSALKLVQLSGYENRLTNQISGGQQQRVALARAIVLRPSVLLLDEPLGALDRRLSKVMQFELRGIQREMQITFIYVTHDHEVAMSMSDRVAVMKQGKFEQVGTPQQIFQSPRTQFVADFMGATNIFKGVVTCRSSETVTIETDNGLCIISQFSKVIGESNSVQFSIRPEVIKIFPKDWNWIITNKYPGKILEKIYLGDITEIKIVIADSSTVMCRLISKIDQRFQFKVGDSVLVGWNIDDCNFLFN